MAKVPFRPSRQGSLMRAAYQAAWELGLREEAEKIAGATGCVTAVGLNRPGSGRHSSP